MKKLILLFAALAAAGVSTAVPPSQKSKKQTRFEDYFQERTMRFDFFHAGNSRDDNFYFDAIKAEPYWGGSKETLVDTTGFGDHFFRIVELGKKREIYSRGFNSLFNEWRHTSEAKNMQRAYRESVIFPYPKKPCRIEIYSRNARGKLVRKFTQEIDPYSYTIEPFTKLYDTFEVTTCSASVDRCLDIVLLPEGFAKGEREKFEEAAQDFAEKLLACEPFKTNSYRINIRAVWVPSSDSGITQPAEKEWKNTAFGVSFSTFGVTRYSMTDDLQKVRDAAGHVPYDCIYILTNSTKYGAGGIFNAYGISSAFSNTNTDKVYAHEMAHLLLGLGDEYVDNVPFSSMYSSKVEPWEANLTALKKFDKAKPAWKSMILDGVPLPTPDTDAFEGRVGAFEGGGYQATGIYRPSRECIMNNLHEADGFCPVCSKALRDYMDYICK